MRSPARALAVVAVVAYAGLASSLEAYSHPIAAVTALPIAVAVVVAARAGWLRAGAFGSSPSVVRVLARDGAGMTIWAVLTMLAAGFQVALFMSNPRDVYPTLSSLASEAFTFAPVRAAAFATWLALGAYLVGRR